MDHLREHLCFPASTLYKKRMEDYECQKLGESGTGLRVGIVPRPIEPDADHAAAGKFYAELSPAFVFHFTLRAFFVPEAGSRRLCPEGHLPV